MNDCQKVLEFMVVQMFVLVIANEGILGTGSRKTTEIGTQVTKSHRKPASNPGHKFEGEGSMNMKIHK